MEIDRKRIAALSEAQNEQFRNRTGKSAETYRRALEVMPNGVPSSFQVNDPWPVYIARGKGSRVWDVDGNEYVDFHNGFGVMAIGHANPDVGAAVKAQIDEGTHFAAPTEGSIAVAAELARRFGLPQWRFTNSGTESTMDAVHIARGATGRDTILKIEGSYHGHHDTVMVSVYPPLEALGARDEPVSVPQGGGIPKAFSDLTRAVPFNDADVLATVLEKIGGEVAGLIMEPAMMNINIIPPREGYLERVRELCDQHGIKLIFDEVKTGATISAGGATARFGVTPDMITLAKASCGGYPGGAIGVSEELAKVIADGTVSQYGTFNGNPLVMAAAEATLTKVLTDDVYAQFEQRNQWLLDGCQRIIDEYGLPCYAEGMGAKGCVVFSAERLYEYRDYLTKVDEELSRLAWLYHMNHGIFMTPGAEEEWTLSIAHADEDLQRYLDAFEAFAKDVTA
ncbi:MAG TPA: aspartate aminotransferase family protein [Solirubrobacterales bacterium]|nr:aspartate aminotransferase family protein [Solirubrobacterales bacterium]